MTPHQRIILKVPCNKAKHGVDFFADRFTVLTVIPRSYSIYDLQRLVLHVITVVAIPGSYEHYFALIHVEWHLPLLRLPDYSIKIVLYDLTVGCSEGFTAHPGVVSKFRYGGF